MDEVGDGAGVVGLPSAIIICESNSIVSKVHDRMPCILRKEDEGAWLRSEDEEKLLKLLKPYNVSLMQGYEVGLGVNFAGNDDKSLIAEL